MQVTTLCVDRFAVLIGNFSVASEMARFVAILFLCLFQFQRYVQAQEDNPSIQEFDAKASTIVQEARSEVMILVNQLMNNASMVTHSAEGNASQLLANLYNDINKGISDAQIMATQIGNTFQANFTKKAEQIMAKAAAIYTKVESSLRESNNRMDKAVRRILNITEIEIAKALISSRAVLAGPVSNASAPVMEGSNNAPAP